MAKRVLAVASGGGHWQELMSLRQSFEQYDVLYMTTLKGLPEQFGASPAVIVPDCNRNIPLKSLFSIVSIAYRLLLFRPQAVISTGAMPGVIALALGRLLGARTIWVDSVANAETMSMSGKLAKHYADLWLSQWEHVAKAEGAEYTGSIL